MTCRICGNEADNRQHVARERMFGLGDEFRYLECSACRCLQIENPPPNLGTYYPENYYSYRPPVGSGPLKRRLVQSRNRYAVLDRGVVGRLLYSAFPDYALRSLSHIPLTTRSRVLDVGCGAGQVLSGLCDLGFKNLLGIDPFNEKDIVDQRGFSILKRSIHDTDGTWDVIMFHHSFEHIDDPKQTLAKVRSMLSATGYCMIRIPVASSYAWRRYGLKWVQLDAPRHLFLHSVKSMELLAAQAKLVVSDIRYDSTAFQFWGSEQYEQEIPLMSDRSYAVNPKRSMFTSRQIAAYSRRARELNRTGEGDQAAFILRCG